METQSKISDISSHTSIDIDSALGTLSDNTPDDDVSSNTASFDKENFKDDTRQDDVNDVGESDMVVSAAMQFSLSPPSLSEEGSKEDIQQLAPSPGGVPIQIKNNTEQVPASQIEEEADTAEGDDDSISTDEVPSELCEEFSYTVEEPSSSFIHYKLPETVTTLSTEEGGKVYLVGTAHFSKESQEDVANTIRMVRPDIVMLELCKSRTAVLQLDEETILNESKSLDFNKMRVIIRQHGKVQGILYLLLLSVSAHITKQLGMAPGGEFRTAFAEARRSAPGCLIQLGDRPIQITLSRALASLPVWQKVKLIWHIMASKESISKEEIEKCKKKDYIEQMLVDMTGQFPAVIEVFVKERDIYLTKSLQTAAAKPIPNPSSPTGFSRPVVVGVVGIGHVPGITEHWGKVTDDDIPPIMKIPPPSLTEKVFKLSFKFALYGLVGYGIYKCVPASAKSYALETIQKNVTFFAGVFSK